MLSATAVAQSYLHLPDDHFNPQHFLQLWDFCLLLVAINKQIEENQAHLQILCLKQNKTL